MEAKILTWGAVVRDLVVPLAGGSQRVVLGLNSIEDYVAHSPYFGAIVGRYGNRIGGARFTLDGETYELDANEGRNQLHGGSMGFGTRLWSIVDRTPSSLTLGLVSEDGDMGYPGRLVATCTYTLLESSRLRIALEATSDRPTPVNLTTHGYFNLDGSPDISRARADDRGRLHHADPARPHPHRRDRGGGRHGLRFHGRPPDRHGSRSASSTTSTTCCAGPRASFATRRPWPPAETASRWSSGPRSPASSSMTAT